MAEPESLPAEKRQHSRFLCTGVELLYSPLNSEIIPNLASSLMNAISHDISLGGLAFDIKDEMQLDEELLVIIKSPDSHSETLKTIVRSCIPIENGYYRIGVAISKIIEAAELSDYKDGISETENTAGVPSQARFACPACKHIAWFNLVGKQEGVPYPAILPLYNCSHCHTTRTIPSLLSFNRDGVTED